MFGKTQRVYADDVPAVCWRVGHGVLFAALILLLFAALPTAEAQGKRCMPQSSGWYYWHPDSGKFRAGSIPLYNNNRCEPPSDGSWGTGKYGMVSASSRAGAVSKCNSMNGVSNSTVSPSGGISMWSCRIPSSSRGGSGNGNGSRGGSGSVGSYDAPQIPGGEKPMTSIQVAAELGMNSGIHFKRWGPWQVGVPSIIDRGVLDVVDVFGNANQYFEVCFPQKGAIVFMDAATVPRHIFDIPTFAKDSYTCGAMNRAGTLVLVRPATESSAQSVDQALVQRFIDATNDPISSAIALEDCEVTSVHNLNMREEPWGVKLDVLLKHTTVMATARTESWFRVNYERDDRDPVEGWIAAWLSEGEGACDWAPYAVNEDSPVLASNAPQPGDEVLSIT